MSKIKAKVDKLRYADYSHLKSELRFYFLLALVIVGIIFLITGVIRIHIRWGEMNSNFVYTICNSIIFGAYFCTLGFFNLGLQKATLRYLVLIVVFIWFMSGLGFFDLIFEFNFPFFIYKYYAPSGSETALFFTINFFLVWLILFAISLATEREVNVK